MPSGFQNRVERVIPLFLSAAASGPWYDSRITESAISAYSSHQRFFQKDPQCPCQRVAGSWHPVRLQDHSAEAQKTSEYVSQDTTCFFCVLRDNLLFSPSLLPKGPQLLVFVWVFGPDHVAFRDHLHWLCTQKPHLQALEMQKALPLVLFAIVPATSVSSDWPWHPCGKTHSRMWRQGILFPLLVLFLKEYLA